MTSSTNSGGEAANLYCAVCGSHPHIIDVNETTFVCPNKNCPVYELHFEKRFFDHGQLENQISSLERRLKEAEVGRKNMLMFFEVASKALGFDPSCDPGKLDPMCTAEAVRGLRDLCRRMGEVISDFLCGKHNNGAKGWEQKAVAELEKISDEYKQWQEQQGKKP